MAIYRQVHVSFWQDSFVLELTPEEKYFYLYLMTNAKTTSTGCYEIPLPLIVIETGYNKETIEKLLAKFEGYNKIKYDFSSKEVFLCNWLKYNINNSPQFLTHIRRDAKSIKSQALRELFNIVLMQYGYSIDTISLINIKENIKEKEKAFATFWDSYPARNGKKLLKADARDFFIKNVTDGDISLLMQAVANYRVSKTVQDGFAKDAIRFLRKDFWRSWIEPEQVVKAKGGTWREALQTQTQKQPLSG